MEERLRIRSQINYKIGSSEFSDMLAERGRGISLIIPNAEGQMHTQVSIIRSEDGLMGLHVAYMNKEGIWPNYRPATMDEAKLLSEAIRKENPSSLFLKSLETIINL